MTPQTPPPKPYAVARTEITYEYFDKLEDALEQWSDIIATQDDVPPEGVIVELWMFAGEWKVSNSQEFLPAAVELE